MSYQMVSCDDHMDLNCLPPKLWEERLPAAFKDRAPKVVEMPQGPSWVREGERWGYHGSREAAGMVSKFTNFGIPEEVEPGVFRPSTPRYRLEDMDRDGVYAQVIYNLLGWAFQDQELKAECLKAFNSWLAEDFCQADPDRLVGLAFLPCHTPQAAIQELARVVKMGLRGAVFDVFASASPIFDEAWDPFWAAAQDSGAIISVHIGGGFHTLSRAGGAPRLWRTPTSAAIVCMQLDEVVASVIFSGILERHPRLRLVMGESGIGWVPFVLERLEYEYDNYFDAMKDDRPKIRPTELFRRQMYVTFQNEKLGVQLIPHIGVDNVMWASDYPHPDGTFPQSREAVESIFTGIDPGIKRKVTRDTAASLYGLTVP